MLCFIRVTGCDIFYLSSSSSSFDHPLFWCRMTHACMKLCGCCTTPALDAGRTWDPVWENCCPCTIIAQNHGQEWWKEGTLIHTFAVPCSVFISLPTKSYPPLCSFMLHLQRREMKETPAIILQLAAVSIAQPCQSLPVLRHPQFRRPSWNQMLTALLQSWRWWAAGTPVLLLVSLAGMNVSSNHMMPFESSFLLLFAWLSGALSPSPSLYNLLFCLLPT